MAASLCQLLGLAGCTGCRHCSCLCASAACIKTVLDSVPIVASFGRHHHSLTRTWTLQPQTGINHNTRYCVPHQQRKPGSEPRKQCVQWTHRLCWGAAAAASERGPPPQWHHTGAGAGVVRPADTHMMVTGACLSMAVRHAQQLACCMRSDACCGHTQPLHRDLQRSGKCISQGAMLSSAVHTTTQCRRVACIDTSWQQSILAAGRV